MRFIFFVLFIFFFLSPHFLIAAPARVERVPAGRVIVSVGSVTGTHASGVSRPLKRGDAVFSGDLIKTDTGSKVQLRFTDDTLVALNETTEFKVKDYQLSPQTANKMDQYILAKADVSTQTLPSNTTLQQNDKMIVALAKGGLRMVTGAIVKTNPDAYQIGTVVGTIGVRGTAFDIQSKTLGPQKVDVKIKLLKGRISIKLPNDSQVPLGGLSQYTIAHFTGDPSNPAATVQLDASSTPVPVNTRTGNVTSTGIGSASNASQSNSFSNGSSATSLPSNTSLTNQKGGSGVCRDPNCSDCLPHPC